MQATGHATIPASRLHDLLNSAEPPHVVDVRTPGEFQTAHIARACNVPLDLLRKHSHEIGGHLERDVVLICRSGGRATQAEVTLRSAGLVNLSVLDGGMNAWERANFAVICGVERWELERQVRLVAGALVLFSVLGSVAAPTAKWLAAGVGGGLVVAAISNTCAMGMLLAKLPYNRGPKAPDLRAVAAKLVDHPAGQRASSPPCSH